MFNNLINKTLYDKRWFILGWSVGLLALVGLTIAFFPTINTKDIGQLFQNVPKQLQSLVGDTAAYSTITGYIGSGVFELRVPMLTIPMAIILAIGLGVGEESSGHLYQLLAQPISRARIILDKWLASVLIMTAIFLILAAGIIVTTALIGEHVPFAKIGMYSFMCWLLTLAVGSFCLMVGAVTGKRGLTTMLASLVAFGSYLITSFATQVSWLKKIDYVSLFHYYHPSIITKYGMTWSHVLILSAVSIISLIIATIGFSNRDVGV